MDTEKKFLEQYDLIKNNIENISSIMENATNIEELNVTSNIKDVVNKFLEVIHFEEYGLSSEEIKDIKNKIKEIKKLLVDLKNRQVYLYNLKVQEINDKIEIFKKNGLNSELYKEIDNLEKLRFNSTYLYKDWKNSNYSRLLDYDKLIKINEIISNIEDNIKLKDDEPLDLRVKINYCEETLKNIKSEYKENMSLEEIDILLDKCTSLFGNVVETDILIRKYVSDGSLKKESEKNYRITTLYSELTRIKNKLLNKKEIDEFNILKNRLEILDKEGNKLKDIIASYYGKSNDIIIKRFNTRFDSLKDILNGIKKDIDKLKKENKLDSNQLSQLELEIEVEKYLFDTINVQLKDPCMLEINLKENLNILMIRLKRELNDLLNDINKLESPIKDKDKIKEINLIIEKKRIDIKYLESHILDGSNLDLKEELKNIKDKFNNICNTYNSKKPLSVKKIKSADSLYEKYNKDCLYASGLASMALLDRFPIIPAIMHGITVMGLKTPVLGGFVNSINNVLGGMINARRDENGKWILSNGIEIDPAVSVTSLFQSLVVSKITNTKVVRKIVNIGKKMNIKYKQLKSILEEDKLKLKFYHSGLDINDFCEKYNLSEEEKQVLKASIAFKYIKENKIGGRKLH